MCTVSYYAHNGRTIITSNRDEHRSRLNALPPKRYQAGNFNLIYSQDARANGTWMALRNDGTVIVLLNGAFQKHTPKPDYEKSRGLVLLDIIRETQCLKKFTDYDLSLIEPFTIILFLDQVLYECIWDGHDKFIREKPGNLSHIWSSVTLYDEQHRKIKEGIFGQFIRSKSAITPEEIYQFHHSKQDPDNGFIINRSTRLTTFSVTQVVITKDRNAFKHHDILNDKTYRITGHEFNNTYLL
jgi:Transport and Golgi organisation 2